MLYQKTKHGILVSIKVSPKARSSAIQGIEGDAWKIRIAAAPEKGAANDALIDVIAEALHIAKTDIELVQGLTSRNKRLLIKNLSEEEIHQRLEAEAHKR